MSLERPFARIGSILLLLPAARELDGLLLWCNGLSLSASLPSVGGDAVSTLLRDAPVPLGCEAVLRVEAVRLLANALVARAGVVVPMGTGSEDLRDVC